ncbi:MAG: mycothiol synthase [Bifidobacteriaceae bacterium]|jgi:mycothiol synthase|nr:mycothiol synthase [Bifidobacteriaceae bacterium]
MKAAEHQALEQVEGALDVAVREQALELADQVRRHDGVEAISEASRLALAAGEAAVTHILAWRGGQLAGYCQRDREGASAELAVAPPARRLGLAKAMIRTLAADTPQVRLWAHGDLAAARRVAESVGLAPVRELREMTSDRRRAAHNPAADAAAPTPAPSSPDAPAAVGGPAASVVFREFDPRTDRAAWVELNAAAFVGHPEQGKLTAGDLDRRMAESWFDAAGLVFAELRGGDGQGGRLVGYVWTKVVGALGEIYAIGVRPEAQGMRLGTKLLEIGLAHMERRGITEIRLFVEADNAPAAAAYRRQGFRVTRRDVQYAF